jgi:hypothetical protein
VLTFIQALSRVWSIKFLRLPSQMDPSARTCLCLQGAMIVLREPGASGGNDSKAAFKLIGHVVLLRDDNGIDDRSFCA